MEDIIKNEKTTLLDVRDPNELLMEGTVEGAINIPMDEIEDRLEEVKALARPIVLFCRSGNRSGQVMDFLSEEGLDDLHNGGGFVEVNRLLQS